MALRSDTILGGTRGLAPDPETTTLAPSFVSRAVFDGAILCTAPRREALERALPAELRLARGAGGDDWHPVLFALGDQTRGASRIAGIEVEWGTSYQEVVVVVPFVESRRTGRLAVYAAGMYSSYYLPNWVGTAAYGYDKRPGAVERRGPIYVLTTPDEGLLLQASVEGRGPWSDAAAGAPEALATLVRIASLPWIGQKPNGAFVRSHARWLVAGARVRPVEAHVVAHHPIARGLPSGTYEPVRRASVEIVGMHWWLSRPRTCVV